jgi:hypothetical protein
MVATQPNVTVTLSGKTATIEATDADMTTLGAVKRIEELVRHRRRRLKRVIWNAEQPPGLVVLAILLGVAAIVLAIIALASPTAPNPQFGTETDSPTEVGVEWVIGIWAAALLTIALSVIMTAQRQAIVIPRTKKDAPSFWERNRDEIAINAIFTVIGGVLGIVGTLLIQSLADR